MSEQCQDTLRCDPNDLQQAMSIHTRKITDSCRDKDCIEDLRVYLTRESQCILDTAAGARVRCAELLYTYIDVEPVAFDRNHYCIDVTFYYQILADAMVGGLHPAPLYGLAVVLPAAARLLGRVNSFGSLTLYLLMAYYFYLMALTIFSHRGLSFARSAEIFATGTYVSLIFSSIVMVRDIEGEGQYLYLLVFLAAWITDSFAYFTGRLFGKHKLIPQVSPKKTVEGAVGGVIFCVIACLGFGLFSALVWHAEPNYLFLGLSGVVLSVCAQIGDLIASLIKREHGIKDYGKLFPGHGGVMDRFDSVAAVAVVLLLIGALPGVNLF